MLLLLTDVEGVLVEGETLRDATPEDAPALVAGSAGTQVRMSASPLGIR